jgi:N-formylglutamate amidohydrolase
MDQKNLLVTIPHSGEAVPPEASWLKNLPEEILMCDVDRFVDRLYSQALLTLRLPSVIARWHRYSGDLNRLPEDVDASTVHGSANPSGKFSRGFLWAITTTGERLMPGPVDRDVWSTLVEKYYEPFHGEIRERIQDLRSQGAAEIYHIDAHSMPSVGTKEHRDPGERRADFVISDQVGKSCRPEFLKLVTEAYEAQGFRIKINWPYIGGRITEMYGRPSQGHHTIQVEMNRSLYMDEKTKNYLPEKAAPLQGLLTQALTHVVKGLAAGF